MVSFVTYVDADTIAIASTPHFSDDTSHVPHHLLSHDQHHTGGTSPLLLLVNRTAQALQNTLPQHGVSTATRAASSKHSMHTLQRAGPGTDSAAADLRQTTSTPLLTVEHNCICGTQCEIKPQQQAVSQEGHQFIFTLHGHSLTGTRHSRLYPESNMTISPSIQLTPTHRGHRAVAFNHHAVVHQLEPLLRQAHVRTIVRHRR